MYKITSKELFENEQINQLLKFDKTHDSIALTIAEDLTLLTKALTTDIYANETTCIDYFKLLKTTFTHLNLLFLTDVLFLNSKPEKYNINVQPELFLDTSDTMFMKQYYSLVNNDDFYLPSFIVSGNQDLYLYKGKRFSHEYDKIVSITDGLINALNKVDVPTLVSIMKVVFLIVLNSHIYLNRDELNNIDKRAYSAPVVKAL